MEVEVELEMEMECAWNLVSGSMSDLDEQWQLDEMGTGTKKPHRGLRGADDEIIEIL